MIHVACCNTSDQLFACLIPRLMFKLGITDEVNENINVLQVIDTT